MTFIFYFFGLIFALYLYILKKLPVEIKERMIMADARALIYVIILGWMLIGLTQTVFFWLFFIAFFLFLGYSFMQEIHYWEGSQRTTRLLTPFCMILIFIFLNKYWFDVLHTEKMTHQRTPSYKELYDKETWKH